MRKKNSASGGPHRPQTDFVLFRYIDSTVEPGKQYQYRVRLQLHNPNVGVTERYLKNPASSKPKIVSSPWSEPTPVVTVPRDVEIFAGPVIQPSTKTKNDPLMRIMVTRLDRERGLKLVADESFRRGNILSIHTTIKPDDATAMVTPTAIDAQINADAVVVDIEGGKPLRGPKSSTAPGETIVLQGDGSLVLRDEFEDESTYRASFPEEAAESPGKTDVAGPAEQKGSRLERAANRSGQKKKKHSKAP